MTVGVLDVSRETQGRLDVFVATLEKWNRRINLIAEDTIATVWDRHVLDSAQLLNLAPTDARTWIDIGSGGGFPGLVVAILAMEERPSMAVTLVEADQRKATFLREAARLASVPVEVKGVRIETLEPVRADVVSARAVAPLIRLLELAFPLSGPETVLIFPKGAQATLEVDEARRLWSFDVELRPSVTSQDGAVLCMRNLRRG